MVQLLATHAVGDRNEGIEHLPAALACITALVPGGEVEAHIADTGSARGREHEVLVYRAQLADRRHDCVQATSLPWPLIRPTTAGTSAGERTTWAPGRPASSRAHA